MAAATVELVYAPSETIQIKNLQDEPIVAEFNDPQGYRANRAAEQWFADHDYVPIPGATNLWEQRVTGVEMVDRSSPDNRSESDNQSVPTFDYWHVWTDQAGVSRQSRRQIQDFQLQSISPPASPQWLGQLKQQGATVSFTVLPVGWIGAWHENPKPQWIIPLSGCWFVETMDGQRVEMGVGEISFGADQNTKEDAQGHKGHLSGTVGSEPAVLMLVQFAEMPSMN